MSAPHELAAESRKALGPSLSPERLAWQRFIAHPAALPSLLLLLLLAAGALAAPLVEELLGVDANRADLFGRYEAPSSAHPLGKDELGRDLLVRLLYGGRISLGVGLVAALAAMAIGSLLGVVAGYFGGYLAALLLPLLPLLIVLAAVDLRKLGLPPAVVQSEMTSFWQIVVLIALFGWTTVARLVRGSVMSLKRREFIRAAEALGARPWRIMLRHLLPTTVTPIPVATTLSVGNVILLGSVLSFLGLGIQPPLPSWGNMLSGAQETLWAAPRLAIWPGVLIFATVISFNFLGDALQDALDPRAIRR